MHPRHGAGAAAWRPRGCNIPRASASTPEAATGSLFGIATGPSRENLPYSVELREFAISLGSFGVCLRDAFIPSGFTRAIRQLSGEPLVQPPEGAQIRESIRAMRRWAVRLLNDPMCEEELRSLLRNSRALLVYRNKTIAVEEWFASFRTLAEELCDYADELADREASGDPGGGAEPPQPVAEHEPPNDWTLAEASRATDVPTWAFSRAGQKPKGEPGHLPTHRAGSNVFVKRKDAKAFARNWDARREQRVVGSKSNEGRNIVAGLKRLNKTAPHKTRRKAK